MVAHRESCSSLDPVVLDTLSRPKKKRKPPPATDEKNPKKLKEIIPWPERHAQYAAANRITDWNESSLPSIEQQTLFPTLRRLRVREFDMLKLSSSVVEFPEAAPGRLINVSQSLGRAAHPQCGSHSMTIATSWRLYDTHRCRLALGIEGFSFQGIHYGTQHHLLAFESDTTLVQLAGNAFHGWCAAAALLAALVLRAEAAAHAQPASSSSSGRPTQGSSQAAPRPTPDRKAAQAALHSLWQ